MAGLFQLAALAALVVAAGCRTRRGPSPASDEGDPALTSSAAAMPGPAFSLPSRTAITLQGVRAQFEFTLQLSPARPSLGELFQIETTLRDASSGRTVRDAQVHLDARMPDHDHGLLTRPVHRELGEGRYRSEGLKLHMWGRWVLRAEAVHSDGRSDHVELTLLHQPESPP